ncbi:MAG: prolyl oligopeptidase family serine peptidase [Muribaculaceae bacterium]|nr:prolyl oligopeptidase family serine peptidase [Muribaculaceae bacterium]
MAVILSAGSAAARIDAPASYPKAPKDTSVVDEYFGMKVADPYRPLENDTAAATLEWVNAERAVTDKYLSQIPFRGLIREQLTMYNDYVKQSVPGRWHDGKYYFTRNDGLSNQSVLYRMDNLGAKPQVVLDPNKLSDDGTVALTGLSMSPDGKWIAYTVSRSGSDWTEIYVLDAATLQQAPDHIEWAKFTGAEWRGNGFFYSAYDRPEAGKEFSNANEYHKIYYHRMGTPQSSDELIFEDKDNPLHFHSASLSSDQRYIFVSVGGQGFGNGLLMKDLGRRGSRWQIIEPSQDATIIPVDVINNRIYFFTSKDAPNYRLTAAPVTAPTPDHWVDILPQVADAVLTGVQRAGSDKMIVTYEKDASDHPALYGIDGKKIRDIELPTYGTTSFSSSKDYDDVFYSFTSFLYPAASYSYDMATGKSKLFFQPEVKGFNPDDFVTEQVFYTSSDGTRVPMFLTYRKDLRKDGQNPVFLYGYGGFNISLPPSFSTNRLVWLNNGGIYAQANLRGGAEYGEEWHEMGTKRKKLNVFDDFISAAEYMIKEGWTNPDKLVINGGSNGGLLVGAVTNMRPDLFKVAVPQVGVMDMMRYHLFTIGWNWAPDYGTSADSPEMAKYLLAYSPLHNIRNDGTRYPAIMVTTADHDDRVVPAHSFKYAATLQAANTGDAPKIIRIDSKAGHGAGKPVSKVIDEWADIYSFIFENLGIDPK